MNLKTLRQIFYYMSRKTLHAIIINFLVLSSIYAIGLNAQNIKSVRNVFVALKFNKSTLTQVFQKIESKTDYEFAFQVEDLSKDIRFTANFENVTVGEVLMEISRQADLKFKQINNTIHISKKAKGNRQEEAIQVIVQGITITGKVISVDDNEGLAGVNVIIKGTTQGTVTDVDGNYSLEVPDENTVLIFSSVGFMREEVTVGNQSVINISLVPDITALGEIVVVGFGTQKMSEVTGAVARADIESFRESPNTNILESLQGTVPGLNIGMVSEAGATPSISIRGQNSISGGQNPLIVLDGIIYYGDMAALNPDDIESIDILKDASSQAIYGAQAANGIILITTKKGHKEGKPVIRYNASYTTVEPSKRLQLEDRNGYLERARDIYFRDAYTEESGYLEENPDFNIDEALVDPENIQGFIDGNNTDWYDLATNRGYIQKHNVSISGASENTNYFLSGGFVKQKNWIINDHFERKSARINFETKINSWLKVGAQTFGSFTDASGSSPGLYEVVSSGPLRVPYDENGELYDRFGSLSNPLIPTFRDDLDRDNNLFGNFYVKIDVPGIPGLNYQINFANDLRWQERAYSDTYARSFSGEVEKFNSTIYDYTLDHIVNYKKLLNNIHEIDITLLVGQKEREFRGTRAFGFGFSNQLLGYNSLEQAENQFIFSDSWEDASLYQMARIHYGFNNKYFVTSTIRRDGYSGFARNEKIATFPSVALGWIASEEPFLSDVNWLDNLKFRLSYGENGNLVERFSSLALVASGPAYVFGDGGSTVFGHRLTTLESPDLKWEKTTGFNLGVDFGLFKGKIHGNIEYYSTVTRDLIWERALPQITGFDRIITNIGELQNHGFEMSLNGSPVQANNFSWDITLNFSANRNKVTKLLGDVDGDGIEDDLISSGLFIGEPADAIYTYEIDGIYQLDDDIPTGYTAGAYRIKEHDGVEGITADDRVIIGRRSPAYRFSIQNKLNYKNFSLNVFINSIQGGQNAYLGPNEPWTLGTRDFVAKHGAFEGVDYWTPSNPDGEYRLGGALGAITPEAFKSRSFVRLQNVTLAYDFEKTVVEKIGVDGLKIYLAGRNLFTWTDWQGWDPEIGSGLSSTGRPVMRNISVGVDITF